MAAHCQTIDVTFAFEFLYFPFFGVLPLFSGARLPYNEKRSANNRIGPGHPHHRNKAVSATTRRRAGYWTDPGLCSLCMRPGLSFYRFSEARDGPVSPHSFYPRL
ncbi:hypothetical protein BS47DRAFT_1347191, partial [Hydnum rufescens UP504]